ncbi:MAG: hypothetical protein R3E79_36585 [Caldilineaceae bacterium]
MIFANESYVPNRSAGCLWAMAKVVLVLVAVGIFATGFFVGLFFTTVAGALM